MTLRSCVIKSLSSKFNLALRIYKSNNYIQKFSLIDTSKVDTSFAQNFVKNDLGNFYKKQGERLASVLDKVDLPMQNKIIEPESIIKKNIDIPLKNITALELPFHNEKDMTEPQVNNISKMALNMLKIRRKKIKKHKRKKFLKRMKFVIAKKNRKKALIKEIEFQKELKAILNDEFTAEGYVKGKLNKLHAETPITKVKGILAPQWVIKQYLDEQEEQRKYEERIEECMKSKP